MIIVEKLPQRAPKTNFEFFGRAHKRNRTCNYFLPLGVSSFSWWTYQIFGRKIPTSEFELRSWSIIAFPNLNSGGAREQHMSISLFWAIRQPPLGVSPDFSQMVDKEERGIFVFAPKRFCFITERNFKYPIFLFDHLVYEFAHNI